MSILFKNMPKQLMAMTLACMALTACSNDEEFKMEDGYISRSIDITDSEHDASVKANKFAWRLLEDCMAEDQDNIVLSPISANICLSMMANAADGESRAQILNTLDYTDKDIAAVNSLNTKLTKQLCSLDKYVKLAFANSFWSHPEIPIKKSFIDDLKENYDIETRTINSTTFINDVNKWCNDKTNGLIPQVLDENSKIYDFAFMNALYFKGFWQKDYKFDSKLTRKDLFYNSDGSTSETDFMIHSAVYPYLNTKVWDAIRIPFSGGAFFLTVIKPREGYSIDDCMYSLKRVEPATGLFYSSHLAVSLPKFKMVKSVSLLEEFKRMGIVEIFDDNNANLTNMSDVPTYVDMIMQKVSFEVNEEGAKAAAVTVSGGFEDTAYFGPDPFYIDHPFIFMISEKSTGAILFLGRINKF